MANIVADINGYLTPIEIDDTELNSLSVVSVEGDKTAYRIEYGNGLVEVGGTAEITVTPIKDGVVEGTMSIDTGLTIINAHATAMNLAVPAPVATGENAFIAVSDKTLKIYATANATAEKTVAVMWSVKGVDNGN